MTFHLYGNILTFYGVAANNRGENQGNITTLQKLLWQGETHTVVSSEAIRWAIRYYWQKAGIPVNRIWNDNLPNEQNPQWQDPKFDPVKYIDDDLLGFFEAESAKKDTKDDERQAEGELTQVNSTVEQASESITKKKRKKNPKPKGTVTDRRGRLDVTRAISTIPYDGKVTFSSKSGKKDRTSIYGTEFHGTRYQFGFGITPESCCYPARVLNLLDAIVSIYRVGGNHGRFLFDFAPESIILRWTNDFAPRFLYCYDEDDLGNISIPKLLRQIRTGDLNPSELWVGGEIAELLEGSEYEGVNKHSGVKATVDALKAKITEDLLFCPIDSINFEENK
ncbi:MAG: type I-B CRISPR-associated protein Cas7/Cst2/DevR [Cyanobacteria bacterium P01_A01_bin.84]